MPRLPNLNPVCTWRPSWRDDGDIVLLLSAFSGVLDKIWFVGGCVRDGLLGRRVDDVDLATALSPDQVQSYLTTAGIRTALYGLSHGTVTALMGGRGFEITTLRRDVATFGRHAAVSFNAHWAEDAARRDFTLNALYLTPDDILYDPFDGRADLTNGRVRFIGESAARIQEDYLRILRFFRFHALFGRGDADGDALRACQAFAPHLAQLSRERIGHEFFKLIMAPRVVETLGMMTDLDVMAVLFESDAPPLSALQDLGRALNRDPDLPMAPRLFCLWPEDEQRHRVLPTLRTPRSMVTMANHLAVLARAPYDPFTVYYRHGAEILRSLLSLPCTPHDRAEYGRHLLKQDRPTLPVTAKDIMAFGVPQGPRVGVLLSRVENYWLHSGGMANRSDCLDFLRTSLHDPL